MLRQSEDRGPRPNSAGESSLKVRRLHRSSNQDIIQEDASFSEGSDVLKA